MEKRKTAKDDKGECRVCVCVRERERERERESHIENNRHFMHISKKQTENYNCSKMPHYQLTTFILVFKN